MRLIVAIGAISLLGACQMTPSSGESSRVNPPMVSPPSMQGERPPSSPTPAPMDSCGAGRLQHLIGQPLPQTIPAAGPVRIYASGDPVTMDYLAARVNIEVDRSPQRQIVAISCG